MKLPSAVSTTMMSPGAISKGELDIEGGAVLAKLLADFGSTMDRYDIEKRLVAVEEWIAKKG